MFKKENAFPIAVMAAIGLFAMIAWVSVHNEYQARSCNLVQSGWREIENEQDTDAINDCTEALRYVSKNPEACACRGMAEAMYDENNLAIKDLVRAMDLAPGNLRYARFLADVYYWDGRYTKATQTYARLDDRRDPSVFLMQARILMMHGESERAIWFANQAREKIEASANSYASWRIFTRFKHVIFVELQEQKCFAQAEVGWMYAASGDGVHMGTAMRDYQVRCAGDVAMKINYVIEEDVRRLESEQPALYAKRILFPY